MKQIGNHLSWIFHKGIHSLLFLLLILMIFSEGQIERDLVNAAADGDVVAVETWLKKGANIEAHAVDDWTPLTMAAEKGHYDVVKLLLEKGAKVNAKEGGGHTALFWAEFHHHESVIDLLEKAGAKNE